MKRNTIFFEILPSIKVNPFTAYYVISWLKWHKSFAMRDCKFNDLILRLTRLK